MPSRAQTRRRKKHQVSPVPVMGNITNPNQNNQPTEEIHKIPQVVGDSNNAPTKGDNLSNEQLMQNIMHNINQTVNEKFEEMQAMNEKIIENSMATNEKIIETFYAMNEKFLENSNAMNEKFEVVANALQVICTNMMKEKESSVQSSRADNSYKSTISQKSIDKEGTGKSSKRQIKYPIGSSNFSGSESDAETENSQSSDSETKDNSMQITKIWQKKHHRTWKIPNFTGKENWTAWINRFEDIAERSRWNNSERLDQMLPCLQGEAGEFVFCELSRRTRNNYKLLIEELNSRYREIEITKTYAVQFTKRNQLPGESIRDYATELKKLYGKTHNNRSLEDRQEDLLRRFYDGLLNAKASFEVEYHKGPRDIDEAVYHMVVYEETRRKPIHDDDYYETNHRQTRRMKQNSKKKFADHSREMEYYGTDGQEETNSNQCCEDYSEMESDSSDEEVKGRPNTSKICHVSQKTDIKDNRGSQSKSYIGKDRNNKRNGNEKKEENRSNCMYNQAEDKDMKSMITEAYENVLQEMETKKPKRKQCQICSKFGHEAKECFYLKEYPMEAESKQRVYQMETIRQVVPEGNIRTDFIPLRQNWDRTPKQIYCHNGGNIQQPSVDTSKGSNYPRVNYQQNWEQLPGGRYGASNWRQSVPDYTPMTSGRSTAGMYTV